VLPTGKPPRDNPKRRRGGAAAAGAGDAFAGAQPRGKRATESLRQAGQARFEGLLQSKVDLHAGIVRGVESRPFGVMGPRMRYLRRDSVAYAAARVLWLLLSAGLLASLGLFTLPTSACHLGWLLMFGLDLVQPLTLPQPQPEGNTTTTTYTEQQTTPHRCPVSSASPASPSVSSRLSSSGSVRPERLPADEFIDQLMNRY